MKKLTYLAILLTTTMLTNVAYAKSGSADESMHDENAFDMGLADYGIGHFDTNRDDNISLKEYLEGNPANTERVYKHLDANGDGMLDRQEQQEIEAVYKQMHEQLRSKTNNKSI